MLKFSRPPATARPQLTSVAAPIAIQNSNNYGRQIAESRVELRTLK